MAKPIKTQEPTVVKVISYRAISANGKVQAHGRTKAEALKFLAKVMDRDGHNF